MSSASEQFIAITEKTGHVDVNDVAPVYASLGPVEPEFLIGDWEGFSINTGHPVHQMLGTVPWAGKSFRSTEDVDPILVYGEDGKRTLYEPYGHARVRKVEFQGVVSAAMIYDTHPIIDSFRYVSEDILAGAMDYKETAAAGIYYFWLKRIKQSKV